MLLSLLNLGVVAGVLVYVFRSSPPGSPDVGLTGPAPAPSAASAAPVAAPVVKKVVVVTNAFHWAQLESEDYKTYVARLRSIGCPDQTVRDIIIADLDKLLAPEMAAAQGRRKDLKYWQPEEEEMLNDFDPREVFRKQLEIDRRKREIIRELVSADLLRERMKTSGVEDYYERRLGFLPDERRTQVREVMEKFDEAEHRIRNKDGLDPAPLTGLDESKLRLIRQQRDQEVTALLSPEEKRQYDLWLSPTANEVRHGLYGMNASEQEFRAVYEERKAFEDEWGQRDPDLLDAATRRRMEEARDDMEGRIEQSLGPERYAQYERGMDDDFHVLSALATRFRLPREKAVEVYGYKVVANGYRDQVRANPDLTAEQRAAALQDIADETRKTVAAALGPRAFSQLVRTGQARWLDE